MNLEKFIEITKIVQPRSREEAARAWDIAQEIGDLRYIKIAAGEQIEIPGQGSRRSERVSYIKTVICNSRKAIGYLVWRERGEWKETDYLVSVADPQIWRRIAVEDLASLLEWENSHELSIV